MSKKSSSALAGALVRARSLAVEMGAAADELNRSLIEAEKAIAALKLGVTASVTMADDLDEQSGLHWSRSLAFGKDKQAWRLLVESDVDGETTDVTPLVNSSRAIRLEAVDHLAALVTKLVDTAATEVAQVRAKVQAVDTLTSSLREDVGGSADDIPF